MRQASAGADDRSPKPAGRNESVLRRSGAQCPGMAGSSRGTREPSDGAHRLAKRQRHRGQRPDPASRCRARRRPLCARRGRTTRRSTGLRRASPRAAPQPPRSSCRWSPFPRRRRRAARRSGRSRSLCSLPAADRDPAHRRRRSSPSTAAPCSGRAGRSGVRTAGVTTVTVRSTDPRRASRSSPAG